MARKKKQKYYTKKKIIIYAIFSIAAIIFTTFTTGKYWVEIIDKYNNKIETKISVQIDFFKIPFIFYLPKLNQNL